MYCRIVGLSAPLDIIPGPCSVGDPSEAWCSVAARGRYGEVASALGWGRCWGSWFRVWLRLRIGTSLLMGLDTGMLFRSPRGLGASSVPETPCLSLPRGDFFGPRRNGERGERGIRKDDVGEGVAVVGECA